MVWGGASELYRTLSLVEYVVGAHVYVRAACGAAHYVS